MERSCQAKQVRHFLFTAHAHTHIQPQVWDADGKVNEDKLKLVMEEKDPSKLIKDWALLKKSEAQLVSAVRLKC